MFKSQCRNNSIQDKDVDNFLIKIRAVKHPKIIYNGEFDPGSGRTLAAGLIHASRTVSSDIVAHGCVTRMQPTLHWGIAFRKGD